MKKYLKNFYLPAMLGAVVEYYDVALFAYMAPIMVQLFLPDCDREIAYFFYFITEFIATIFQIIGAKFFGSIGDYYGRKPAMYFSMLGMSIVTFLICFLPVYKEIGLIATYLLMLMRILQGFFLGGEYNGGVIYCMEHEKNERQHGIISGLYCFFTVLGIILASSVALICNFMGPEYFRWAYGLSALLMFGVFKMRQSLKETSVVDYSRKKRLKMLSFRIPIVKIMMASLFFGVLYGIPTKVLNSLLPIATNVSGNEIMLINLISLMIYGGLLFFFGCVSSRYSGEKMMRLSIVTSAFLSYPLIAILNSNLWLIIIVKILFMILLALFMGPFHAWAQKIPSANSRYEDISTSYAIGKSLSTLIIALSFLAYEYFEDLRILGMILLILSIITKLLF